MAKSSKRRLLLLCAGPTDWDRAGRLQGSTDLPLPQPSFDHLNATLAGIDLSPLTLVLTSPDEASKTIAALIAERSQAKLQESEDLRELDLGLWTGLRLEELESRFERAGKQWLEDPSLVAPPEGETLAHLALRLLPILEKAVSRKRAATSIAVVLRPIAYALLRTLLEHQPPAHMHAYFSLSTTSPDPIWFDIARKDDRLAPSPAQSGEPTNSQTPAA